MLLSADMYIVVKAGILLDKIKCFFSYVSSLPSLSFIHSFIFFFYTLIERQLSDGTTYRIIRQDFALRAYALEENMPSYFLGSCKRMDS